MTTNHVLTKVSVGQGTGQKRRSTAQLGQEIPTKGCTRIISPKIYYRVPPVPLILHPTRRPLNKQTSNVYIRRIRLSLVPVHFLPMLLPISCCTLCKGGGNNRWLLLGTDTFRYTEITGLKRDELETVNCKNKYGLPHNTLPLVRAHGYRLLHNPPYRTAAAAHEGEGKGKKHRSCYRTKQLFAHWQEDTTWLG